MCFASAQTVGMNGFTRLSESTPTTTETMAYIPRTGYTRRNHYLRQPVRRYSYSMTTFARRRVPNQLIESVDRKPEGYGTAEDFQNTSNQIRKQATRLEEY